MTRAPFFSLFIAVVLTIVFYLVAGIFGGGDKVLHAFSHLGVSGFALVCSLSFLCYVMRFIRWNYFLNILGYRIPFKENLRIYFGGFALTATPGKSGEGVRSIFLKEYGIKYRESLAAFVSERLFDMITVSLIAIFGLIKIPSMRPVIYCACVIIFLMLFLIQNPRLIERLRQLANQRLDFIFDMFQTFRVCFTLQSMLIGITLGMISWGFEVFGLYFICQTVTDAPSLWVILLTLGCSLLAGSLTFLPGGVGGTEAVMIHLLTKHGILLADAVAITLAFRLATLWFATTLGLITFPYRKLRFSS